MWTEPTATDEICPEESEEVIAAPNRIRPNPFPTALLGEYGEQQFAVVSYASSLAVPRLLLASVWWYALRRNLLSESLDPRISRYHLARSLAIPALFSLSIIVSFFSVSVAVLSWLLMFAVDSVLWRLARFR